MGNKCKQIKINNKECCAYVVKGDQYCFWHSKKMKEKRELAIRDGGRSLKRNYCDHVEVKIRNSQDILLLVEQTLNDLRRVKTSTKIATTVGYLAGIALKIIGQSEIERRLEVIEYALKIKNNN